MSEKRKYRTFTPELKLEIVPAGLRGDRSVRDVCCENEIAECRVSTTLENWSVATRWFPGMVATPCDSGGHVVIVSSCQERAGASPAVGQTSKVRGAARARVEH